MPMSTQISSLLHRFVSSSREAQTLLPLLLLLYTSGSLRSVEFRIAWKAGLLRSEVHNYYLVQESTPAEVAADPR